MLGNFEHNVVKVHAVRGSLRCQPSRQVPPVEQRLRPQVQEQASLQLQLTKAAQSRFETRALERNADTGGGRGSDQSSGWLERAALRAACQGLVTDGHAGGPIDDGLKDCLQSPARDQSLNRVCHVP